MGSAKNLVYSLAAVLGMVAVLVLIVPRVSSVSGPPVDVHATAVDVQERTGWPIVEPVGLPEGVDCDLGPLHRHHGWLLDVARRVPDPLGNLCRGRADP